MGTPCVCMGDSERADELLRTLIFEREEKLQQQLMEKPQLPDYMPREPKNLNPPGEPAYILMASSKRVPKGNVPKGIYAIHRPLNELHYLCRASERWIDKYNLSIYYRPIK